ncbi:hypothetical protein JTB14_022697 [Gonioctena quinquepunctata]|nr:hypothetical protein JTB14_022697 [Gonioctena quinquepunctata]
MDSWEIFPDDQLVSRQFPSTSQSAVIKFKEESSEVSFDYSTAQLTNIDIKKELKLESSNSTEWKNQELNTNGLGYVKIENDLEDLVTNNSHFSIETSNTNKPKTGSSFIEPIDIKGSVSKSHFINECSDSSSSIETLLVKCEEPEQESCEQYQLDIQKEIEKCIKEDKEANTVHTIVENNTTSYKCQMCDAVFLKFPEYNVHKKNHFMEKRRCKICNVTLKSISKLQDHLYKHLNMKPFSCDECGKSFLSKHHVKLHQKCHNTEKTFQCTKCDKAFKNKGSLRSHQLVHVERVQEFICKVCSLDCKNLPDFRKHMEGHGKRSEIKCGLCNKTFGSDRGLECHLKSHTELKFPCEYCGKIYPSMYRIKRHIKRAHIPNHCEECKKVFYDRALYTKHIKEHNANKAVECEYCQKKFDKAKNLSEHIRLQHKQDEEKKKCHICGKEFINNALLKNHVKIHDKCFKCPHCDRLFASRYNLETHSVTHSGAKNHKCTTCEKSFSTKTGLKNHYATHNEDRLFQCEICAKTFKTNRRLYVHKLCHATEEKYECEICLQKFRVKQYLKYHMNKHSTNKPFECSVCKKRFKHKKSKEKHMIIGKHKHKGENEHDCDFCDETFSSRELLLDHFAAIHHQENIINSINECEGADPDTNGYEEAEEPDDSIKKEKEDDTCLTGDDSVDIVPPQNFSTNEMEVKIYY